MEVLNLDPTRKCIISVEDQLQDSWCFYGKQGDKCLSLESIQNQPLDCHCKLKESQKTQKQPYLDNL